MKRKSVYTCLVMLLMSLVLQAKDKDVAVACPLRTANSRKHSPRIPW